MHLLKKVMSTISPILFFPIFCLTQAAYADECYPIECCSDVKKGSSKSAEHQSEQGLLGYPQGYAALEGFFFPLYSSLNRLLFLDLELSFIYMQRSWRHLLDDLPNIFDLPSFLSLQDKDPPNEDDESTPPITDNSSIQEEDCCTDYLSDYCCDLEWVCSSITLRHIEPGGIGYCKGYTTLEGLFFPVCSPCLKWPLLDVRLHYFNNNEWAGNIGLGSRILNPCTNVVHGFNFFFDFRSSCRGDLWFPQAGIGLERLSPCWDLRINGYLPWASTKTIKRCHFEYPGGFFIDRHKQEVALRGIDLEVGRCLFQMCCFEFYGAIGPYFYGRAHCQKSFVGGRARASLSYSRYLSIEGIATYDQRYKAKFQGSFAITIPLGCCPKRGVCQDILSQRIYRNEIIVLDSFCKWKSNF